MKKLFYLPSLCFGLILFSACEDAPSEDWKEKDGAAEKQLQIMCEGFKEL